MSRWCTTGPRGDLAGNGLSYRLHWGVVFLGHACRAFASLNTDVIPIILFLLYLHVKAFRHQQNEGLAAAVMFTHNVDVLENLIRCETRSAVCYGYARGTFVYVHKRGNRSPRSCLASLDFKSVPAAPSQAWSTSGTPGFKQAPAVVKNKK